MPPRTQTLMVLPFKTPEFATHFCDTFCNLSVIGPTEQKKSKERRLTGALIGQQNDA
jgi:hypothetical protein